MTTHLIFEHPYRAIVIGASGAIGGAFARAFHADPHCDHVVEISRSSDGFEITDAESIRRHAEACRAAGPFQIIVDATGALHVDGQGPEKSLASVNLESMTRNLQLNAIGPLLAVRSFAPLLASGPSIYAKLSARVGSITDNRKGGWYGYRSAKAALNMMLQTAAIELQRRNPMLRVVAMQPGTVRSALSAPFQAGVENLLEPDDSVLGLIRALKDLPMYPGAQFIDHRGESIPW